MTLVLGDRVIAVVNPDLNGGADEAPAVVTRLVADGEVDLSVSLNGGGTLGLASIAVFDDRAAVDAWLDEQLPNIGPQQDDPHGSARPPERSDVLKWASAAYLQSAPAAAAAPPAAEAPAA